MTRLRLALTLSTSIALPSGCAVGLAEASSAATGCAEQTIRISDAHTPFLGKGAPIQWTATCGGVRHYCIQTSPERTICTVDPRVDPSAPPDA
jgi:hypothetical protein